MIIFGIYGSVTYMCHVTLVQKILCKKSKSDYFIKVSPYCYSILQV